MITQTLRFKQLSFFAKLAPGLGSACLLAPSFDRTLKLTPTARCKEFHLASWNPQFNEPRRAFPGDETQACFISAFAETSDFTVCATLPTRDRSAGCYPVTCLRSEKPLFSQVSLLKELPFRHIVLPTKRNYRAVSEAALVHSGLPFKPKRATAKST